MIRVLLIDDEAGFTLAVKLNLEAIGSYEVDVVNESERALAKALEFKPDIIFLDVVMPGIDGGDVLILFRSHEQLKDVPIILLTALVGTEDTPGRMGVAEEAGQVMLAKPVNLSTLIAVAEQALKTGRE